MVVLGRGGTLRVIHLYDKKNFVCVEVLIETDFEMFLKCGPFTLLVKLFQCFFRDPELVADIFLSTCVV